MRKPTQSPASRHFTLDSEWSYAQWMAKLDHGMIHFQVDGKGEIWLMPGDNWQDVLQCLTGLPKAKGPRR